MIEKLKKQNTWGECLEKLNELVDAVNELQLVKDVMFNRIDMLNNAICDIRNRITTLDDPTYHEKAQDMYDNAILDALKDKQVDVVVEPADPYAEQRKWIGKLCRCWDSDINDDTWGILQDVKDNKTEKYYLYGIGYEHCEPVKPDDDIIYKGGDNE